MLHNSRYLEGCSIGASDGTIGDVEDLYFDDEAWAIRYLVVSTGLWLANRKVLISPYAIGRPPWEKILPASITMEQVRHSPDIDTDKPVSRQHERQYLGYYRYPYYWGSVGLWAGGTYPNTMLTGPGYGGSAAEFRQAQQERDRAEIRQHQDDDPHLRSCNAVKKYHIRATDGDIGHVSELLIDDETWAIRYLVVDTSNWWLGHSVLVAPQWIDDVSWFESKVLVNLSRQAVRDAPLYDAAAPPDRDQEVSMYQHYGRSGYWEDGSKRAAGQEGNPMHQGRV
jgi:PRC-barrel domain protein